MNAGQLDLGSSRPESSRPGSTWTGNISAWSYFAYFIHKGCQYEVCFIQKYVQKKFEGIMIGSIYIVGPSILSHSTGPTALRYERRTRNIFLSCLFLKQKEKKSAVPVYDGSYIFTNIYDPSVLGPVLLIQW